MMKKIYIGTSGFLYEHWGGGVFYPRQLRQKDWLQHYCKYFDNVELNVTFYRLPTAEAFLGWYKKTPKNFTFAVKGSRFITHIKRIKDCKEPLKLFFSRAKNLKEKLGVVLWQLPPSFKADAKRLEKFLIDLKKYKYRHAFEFRNKTWLCDEVFKMLKKYNASLCLSDYPGCVIEGPITADFVYVRRHGISSLYGGCYSREMLQQDAANIKKWRRQGKTVFEYFNNDACGYAVRNALELKDIV